MCRSSSGQVQVKLSKKDCHIRQSFLRQAKRKRKMLPKKDNQQDLIKLKQNSNDLKIICVYSISIKNQKKGKRHGKI